MFRSFFRKRRERRAQKLREDLEWITGQISRIHAENQNLVALYTKIESEQGQPSDDQTREIRVQARHEHLRHNSLLLGDLGAKKQDIERRLNSVATPLVA